jgi:hypothetical protein
MPKSERRRHEEQQDRVANVVAALLSEADADVYNWADEAALVDAMQAVYALAKLAAVSISREAVSTGESSSDVLRATCVEAFGRAPELR